MSYRALTVKETARRLAAAENPLIVTHVRPDGDAVASSVALLHLFRLLGRSATLFCEEAIPERLRFITENAPRLPYHAAADYTVITVDVASPSRLPEGLPKEPSLMIDHHAFFTPVADYLTVPEAAAAGEVLFSIAMELLESHMIAALDPATATALYTAISSDSGGFRLPNTTAATHITAAALLSLGAESERVNHALFVAKSQNELRAEAITAERITLHADGRISAVALEDADLTRGGLSHDDFETAVDIARSVRGVIIAVVVKRDRNTSGKYHVSLRSTGPDVASVASALGGGGHIRAAGCTVEATSAVAAFESIFPRLAALL